MRAMLGDALDFTVRQVNPTEAWRVWPFLALGALLGVAGSVYNAFVMGLLGVADRLTAISSLNRAAIIGAVVGLAAWFAPNLVGGGDTLTQTILANPLTVGSLTTIFLLRFLIGPWSYAAGLPGGLFAPMLLLGASAGALFAGVINHFSPAAQLPVVACAIVGMATLFTACVRAPLTGIVLTVEMTGRADLSLGLLGASLIAMVVAMLLQSEPIYESLKRRMMLQAAVTPGRVDVGYRAPPR
jgi:CIC family chloride channel protein